MIVSYTIRRAEYIRSFFSNSIVSIDSQPVSVSVAVANITRVLLHLKIPSNLNTLMNRMKKIALPDLAV